MLNESLKMVCMLFSVSLFNKQVRKEFKIHSFLALTQYILYGIYLIQKDSEGISLLNEVLNVGVLSTIILCIQSESHVFIIWFLWNISFVHDINAFKDLLFSSSLCIGMIGSLSLKRIRGKVGGRSPEEYANFEQLITFSWFNDLLDYGLKNVLNMENIYNLMEKDTSKTNYEKFKNIRNTQPSLLIALFTLVKPCVIVQAGFALISSTLSFSGPFFLNRILKYVEGASKVENQDWAFLLVVGLFVASSTRSIADGQTYFLGRRIGTRVRAALIGELYSKSLKRIQSSSTGDILNLMSVDCTKVLEVSCYLMYVWTTPLQVLICISFLLNVLGWPALTGIGIMVLMVPMGRILGRVIAKRQKILMQSSDKRMSSTLELLYGIRLIKFFAWETNFLKEIDGLRDTELINLWSYIKIIALNKIIWYSTPILVSFCTFATLTLVAKEELTPSKAFTGLALFNTLKSPLQIFPDIIVRIEEALVSLRRISDFLQKPDLDSLVNLGVPNQDISIGFPKNSSFVYHESSSMNSFHLHDIKVSFPDKGLSLIIGPTGSGKSSLLLALLGEMKCIKGGSSLRSIYSEVAYVSQNVWLLNATIRENILFGEPFDESRYLQVIQCCSLLIDLQNLPGGDSTEIGESGVNLSGGQKARISLARAAYSSAACIILDDPLSAVDAPTARFLFENCICGPLMSARTRILVTHSVSLCASRADFALILSKGCIINSGGKDFINRVLSKDKTLENSDNYPTAQCLDIIDSSSQDSTMMSKGSLTTEETRSSGAVSSRVYLTYCYAAGGICFIFGLVFMFTLTQSLIVGNDLWLKTWASSTVGRLSSYSSNDEYSTIFYLSIYGLISAVTILVIFSRIILVATGSIRASSHLHRNLLRRILGAPVRFFETTPSGRIMNRFTKDMKDIDQEVASYSADFVANLFSAFATVLLISIVTPWTLLGLLPITIAYYTVARKYLCTSRELKRLEATTRSPIFSHFGEALQGASTIRSYGASERFMNENHKKVDINHRAFFFLWISNRWLALRIDIIGSLVTLFSASSIILLTIFKSINAGNAGITLSYALALTDALLWLVRMHAVMEMEMNAVERVDEYMSIEQEFASIVDSCRPTEGWPHEGRIEVKDLCVRYSEHSPVILNNISFSVEPGQKVGRTGAGKSSLSLAFFRFIEPYSGSIVIDGINILKMGLYDLRSNLTIIPQHPTLFSGTVRSNLDPFGQYLDGDMLIALKRSHLLETKIKTPYSSNDNLPTADKLRNAGNSAVQFNISLDSAVEEGGHNFSQGQRQLLCLARAILKKSRVIILDEATASVDHETDSRIQKTIREEFHGCTILCIAHRIRTVMDYDRILVLKKGVVEEFGTPLELAVTKNGTFSQMCLETGEYEELLAMGKRYSHDDL